MAKIINVTVGSSFDKDDVLIKIDNGTSICATLVTNELAEGMLICHNGKLILLREDYSCKVLREGVSVR
mgnify:CR=1 FL=1